MVQTAGICGALAIRILEFNVSSESVMHDKSELVSLLSDAPAAIPAGSSWQTPLGVALVQVCFVVKMPLCEDYVIVKRRGSI